MKSYLEEIKDNLELRDIANIKVALEFYILSVYSEDTKKIMQQTLKKLDIEV